MKRALVLALFGLCSFSSSLEAQSLFGTQGLGMYLEPLDARARALGSVGVGLLGPSLSPLDLAASAGVFLPTAQITLQPHWVDGDLAGQPISTSGTRFPQIGLAYPIASLRGTAVLHLGSLFDQRWEVEETSDQVLQGEEVSVEDVFTSDGGVSTVQLGWAQNIGAKLSMGIGVGTRIGSVTRTYSRTIDDALNPFQTIPFESGGEWRYSGMTGSVGVQWDPIQALRIGGNLTWTGELKAKPIGYTEGELETFDLPIEYRIGASGLLTPRLALNFGVSYADWKPSNEFLGPEEISGSVLSYGGGIEWAGPQVGVRNFPIRLGMRRSDLPFTFDGEKPTENVYSGGIGVNLIPAQVGLLGSIDLAAEKGTREAGALSESFWRISLSVRVGSY